MTRAGNVLIVLAVAIGGGTLAACASKAEAPGLSSVETVAPATDPPVTSTTPPTTQAPTTTIDPAVELAAAVEADLLEAFRLGREASQDPFNAEKEQAALDRRLGVIAESFAATQADYRARNYALRPNLDVPASVTVEGEPVFLGPNSEVAEVQICEVNSWLLVEVGAGPNGTDAVVDPDVIAVRATIFMRDVDGLWKFEGSNLIEEWQGVAECAVG